VPQVRQVEPDRVADARGEAALQDEEAPVGGGGGLEDAETGVGAGLGDGAAADRQVAAATAAATVASRALGRVAVTVGRVDAVEVDSP
jgi:hypothetical protein